MLSGLRLGARARAGPVNPQQHFTCCGWPWLVPELAELILSVLRSKPGGYALPRLHAEMRRELRRTQVARNPKGCVRDCLDLQLPGPQHMSGVLRELEARGKLELRTVQLGGKQGKNGQARTLPTMWVAIAGIGDRIGARE